jgi:OFA family oxalate/formate antiporter-like MFS transporter
LTDSTEDESEPDPIASRVPFFYGWVMLPIVLAIQVSSSPGQTFAVSVFNPYIRHELGLSHSEISGAYMLGTLLASLPMMFVGALMDRYGPRIVLTGVVALFGLTCVGFAQATGLVTVFLSFLFLRMLAQGSMGLLTANTVAMWFNRRLGFALGLISTVSALSMGVVPTMSLWLIQSYGWRWSYAILGLAVVAMVLPLLAIVFRNRPEDVGQLPDGASAEPVDAEGLERRVPEIAHDLAFAIRTRAYWIMAVTVTMPAMIITGIHFHAVQIYLDVGMGEADAARMFSVFAVAVAGSMLAGGVMADRFRLNLLLSGSLIGISGGIWLLTQVASPWMSYFFAIVLGVGQGVFMSVRSTIWVRYYGRAHLGKIRGTLTTIEVAASSTGPLLMGAVHDHLGSYHSILTLFAVVTAPLIFVTLFATPPEVVNKSAGKARNHR